MLKLERIKKSYHVHLVLQIPSLQLVNGIYWLKGANGSGKTTLLRMIAGLLPFEGDISFHGINLKQKPLAYRQWVSWAEAEPLFPEFVSGNDLLILYRQIRKASVQEIDDLIEIFGMGDYVNDATGTYSEGMKKKLSLALAFIGNPSLIALDEPFITLDTNANKLLREVIAARHSKQQTMFLMSSHHEIDTDTKPGIITRQLIVKDKTVIS